MPEFILDTAGAVQFPSAHGGTLALQWGGLSDLAQGYVEALFFTESEGSVSAGTFDPENGSALPEEAGFASLDKSALDKIITDCAAFERAAAADLAAAYETGAYDARQAGRDFWFTRNGHGVGFWDRDALKPDDSAYEALTAEMVAAVAHSEAWGAALAKRQALEAEGLGERLSKHARAFGETWASYDAESETVFLD